MTDSLLIFTFSPIQSFIAEARRAEDLYKGSKILSRLANAVCKEVGKERLIYPAEFDKNDTPNVLVMKVSENETAKDIADKAKVAMWKKWEEITADGLHELRLSDKWKDDQWKTTWNRQTQAFWEVYWVAVPYDENQYKKAYDEARKTLDAVKRSRVFEQPEGGEQGEKDSLSGKRQALYMANVSDKREKESPAKAYWRQVAVLPGITQSKLRPNGRERLDAIAVIKRFAKLEEEESFLSTSSVATMEFVKNKAHGKLGGYKKLLDDLVDKDEKRLFKVSNDPKSQWPYDGDLLYPEALTPKYLKDSYDLTFDKADAAKDGKLWKIKQELKDLYRAVGDTPSKYYAIIMLDGDGMGKYIDEQCKEEQDHRVFSKKIANFSEQVDRIVKEHNGSLIFNGGDDVLCMAPLASAIPLAMELADEFKKITPCTASAGIAITHHQSPLDAALEAARKAEHNAKQLDDKKNAVYVCALKRSGETLEVHSKWVDVQKNFADLVRLFGKEDGLSSRFAYDAKRSAYAMPDDKDIWPDMWQSELKRLLLRHGIDEKEPAIDWSKRLSEWTVSLPGKAEELSNWLILARFIAQGGGE